jgi:CRP-like cAMP-binding protein
MFSACNQKQLRMVSALTERVRVPEGRELCRQGAIGREFFIILDGRARVSRNGRKVAALGAGQCFGELALLDPAPRNATVVAETDMDLLVLAQREFAKVVDATPGFAFALLAGLAARMRESETRRAT